MEALLDAEADLTVTAAVPTAAEAMAACLRHRADVLVADYRLPDLDGLSLSLRVEGNGGPPTVLYSAFADTRLAVLAIVAGVSAIVDKAANPDELVAAVRAVAAGIRPLAVPGAAALSDVGGQLDPGDLPVLGMLTAGVKPSEIAQTLGVEEASLAARRRAMVRSAGP